MKCKKVLKEKLHSHENNSYEFCWIFQFTLARGLYKRHIVEARGRQIELYHSY